MLLLVTTLLEKLRDKFEFKDVVYFNNIARITHKK